MKTLTILLIICTILGTAFAREIIIPTSYLFKYGVADHTTGDIKSHSEVRLGNEVIGEYSLKEADGTTRVVKYTAGPKTGFRAVVAKEGQPDLGSTLGTLNTYGSFAGSTTNLHRFKRFQEEPVATGYDF